MVKKANSGSVEVILSDLDEKKHVAKYTNESKDAALSSVYISNAAFKALGNPKSIKVTIEAA